MLWPKYLRTNNIDSHLAAGPSLAAHVLSSSLKQQHQWLWARKPARHREELKLHKNLDTLNIS